MPAGNVEAGRQAFVDLKCTGDRDRLAVARDEYPHESRGEGAPRGDAVADGDFGGMMTVRQLVDLQAYLHSIR